jgi:anti-sigma factor RsiW
MSDCRAFVELLPLHAGGDLDPVELAEIESHLSGCEACRRTLSEYQTVISSDGILTSGDMTLSDIARRKIALESSMAARGTGRFWLPRTAPGHRSGALAVAAAAIFALVAIPFVIRHGDNIPRPVSEITEIDVVSGPDGQVTLAWTNGSHDAYTVYKSSDPKNFRDGEAHVVLGTVWTDSSPAPGQVVFYRVE